MKSITLKLQFIFLNLSCIARSQSLVFLLILSSISSSGFATHYINKTGRSITITNVSEKKRQHRKNMWTWGGAAAGPKKYKKFEVENKVYFINLDKDVEGDLDNKQDDEVTITSQGMSDKRKLFPTNNSFNYVITMNKYKSTYEQFDVNHAGEEKLADKQKHKKNKKKYKKHESQ
ncbi:hypothetical protein KBC04_03580 [Candidatus Babeliales bacterium]|nr:hypothetical protein [Candidatus Babeliales bacterium]MBP9843867.1 hypothetical protein [Candidatus Babeliales bacterium]